MDRTQTFSRFDESEPTEKHTCEQCGEEFEYEPRHTLGDYEFCDYLCARDYAIDNIDDFMERILD